MRSIRKKIKSLTRVYQSEDSRRSAPTRLTRDAVRWAYRLFLDREPENEQVVDDHLLRCSTTQDLRGNFIFSREFETKNPMFQSPVLFGDDPPMSIEAVTAEDDLQRLFDHIKSAWQELGKTEPYWSVVISDKYRQENIQANEDEFYRTGDQHVIQLFGSLERNNVVYRDFKTCLDYGCGVGRISRHLAARFEKVLAYDISVPHLQLAEEHLSKERISNVTLRQIKSVRDLEHLPKVDVAYSIIVLQHNPPPVISFIIGGLIKALNPGGIAFFQVPTYRQGYEFSLAKYLSNNATKQGIEMHVLPQREIFEIAQRAGGRVLEVVNDGWTGNRERAVSNIFVIQKR